MGQGGQRRLSALPRCRLRRHQMTGRGGLRLCLVEVAFGVDQFVACAKRRITSYNVCYTKLLRMDPKVPLVVPEVNPHAIAQYSEKGIIANPNCSTIQMVVVLHPIHEKYGIKRIVVSTYQAVSGTGKKAIDELFDQTRAMINFLDYETRVYPHRIAFT